MTTKEHTKSIENSNINDVTYFDNKPILDIIILLQEYYKKSEEHNINTKIKIGKLEDENEGIYNLINNPQKFNVDASNYIKLSQSNKELQEKFDSLSSQLETKNKEIDRLSLINENNTHLIEAKEIDIKNLEKINSNLKAETLKYQFALGAATTYQLGDNDKNNSVRLNEDIERLQDTLEDYVTNLRTKTKINYKKINNLLIRYHCNLKMNARMKDLTLIKALLQRYVIDYIYEKSLNYFENINNIDISQSLESEINFKVKEL
ncbi:hypothetical protein C1645_770974, partial [Glomus cerebriforme]